MAQCTAKRLAWHKPRPGEVITRVREGASEKDAYLPVLRMEYCAYPRRHHGACDFRTARWIVVRAWVRVITALAIVAVFVVIGSIDSPSLH